MECEQAFQDLKKYLAKAPLLLTPEPGFSGRISTWFVELRQYDIDSQPRAAIKGQVLADFVGKFSHAMMPQPPMRKEEATGIAAKKGKAPAEQDPLEWKLFIDGSACNTGSGIGVVLFPHAEVMLELFVRLGFSASNNVAEYEALLAGLRSAKTLKVKRIMVYCDSQLMVNQLSKEYEARNEKMAAYIEAAKDLLDTFEKVYVEQISFVHAHVDSLAWLATAVPTEFKRKVAVDYLSEPSIGRSLELVLDVNQGPSWMDPIVEYLRDETLPFDKKEAHKIKTKFARFWLFLNGKLYRKSITGPYLLCVHPEMVQKFLHEIHEETCGSHTGGRSKARRAITQGYWWPHMQEDAKVYTRLDKAKGKWPDELPLVLWAHRAMLRRSTGETPYSLVYGTEAVIPLKVGLPTNKTALVESGGNNRALAIELDLAEERRGEKGPWEQGIDMNALIAKYENT
ncbi:uncharacterized protein LOC131298549 [Rhododendron vialii]|uniref:uncharacterized protein LOC131298549 n=1 Tax=Rhododendron vialii TaxID=182163 RepID=UPI00265FC72F|nr:uncharacterized protein LOC131298549 [Rhododendron vialii]